MKMVKTIGLKGNESCFHTVGIPSLSILFPFHGDDDSALRGAAAITLAKGFDNPDQHCLVQFCFTKISTTLPQITFQNISGGKKKQTKNVFEI